MILLESTPEQYKESFELKNKAKESSFDLSRFVVQRPAASIVNGIGHVFVQGMLLNNAAPIDLELGATDYKQIIADLRAMIDGGASAIVLHVNSGGGTCNGALEAAQAVETCPVPIVALVDGVCASAAFKIACAATWIVSNPSSVSGSIGTILVVTDTGTAYKAMGITFDCFTGEENDLKSTGHLPSLSEPQKEFLTESINEASASFKAWVLSNRPGVNNEVFRSGFYTGAKALELGLIDEIGNDQTAIARAEQLAAMTTFLY
jgi:protease-4